MHNYQERDEEISNSDIIKHTLMALITVAKSKTSDDYAWASIKKLLNELRGKYDFLKYISIDELELINYTSEDIIIENDFDNVEDNILGVAIQDIIDLLKKYLGKKAGYFFFQEFKNVLGEKYHEIIKKMGVDLRLMELQKDFSGIEIKDFKIKDSSNSNIAFVEKVM
jgi:hypothetical protein